MKNKKINIPLMFCFDTNYVIPASAAFYSLLEHANKKYDYTFYVLHSDITEYQQQKLKETIKEFKNCTIKYIDMNNKLDNFWTNNYQGGHFSKEVMYKLLVASIFPDIDKIIVSDVDVIFLGDISDSYFQLTDADDAYIAGVKPIGKVANYLENYLPKWTQEEISKLGEICGGYLVMNLKKIREDNFEKVFLKSLEENGKRLNQMEQDIFNITCNGKIKHLDLKYVACSYMWDYYKTDYDKETDINYTKEEIEDAMNNTVQLHYATSIKPWKNVDCTLSHIWFKYIVKTPFLEEYLHNLPNKIVIQQKKDVAMNAKKTLYRKIADKIPFKIRRVIKSPTILLRKDIQQRILKKIIPTNIKQKIKRRIFKPNFSYLIFDDVYPSELSPFRYEEFTAYANRNYNTYVGTTGSSLSALKEYRYVADVIKEFQKQNPHFKNKIFNISTPEREESLKKIKNIKNPLAIIVFQCNLINDLYDNLTFLEENNIPFVFTLYPGGGLVLNDKKSFERLKRILSSKCFRKVFVTQDNVKQYLLEKKLCTEEKIKFIFGVVIPQRSLEKAKENKIYYPNKKFLDICFVAHRYSTIGKDKGYDLFIDAARKIKEETKINNIRFHIVGDFNENTIPIEGMNNIIFHDCIATEDLNKLFTKMDIIISPTRPNILSKGAFDGFPTAATVEAMINGVMAIATDELSLNNGRFKENEMIIIKPNAEEITKILKELYNDPQKIKSIAQDGQKKVIQLYSIEAQITERIKTIDDIGKKEYRR